MTDADRVEAAMNVAWGISKTADDLYRFWSQMTHRCSQHLDTKPAFLVSQVLARDDVERMTREG